MLQYKELQIWMSTFAEKKQARYVLHTYLNNLDRVTNQNSLKHVPDQRGNERLDVNNVKLLLVSLMPIANQQSRYRNENYFVFAQWLKVELEYAISESNSPDAILERLRSMQTLGYWNNPRSNMVNKGRKWILRVGQQLPKVESHLESGIQKAWQKHNKCTQNP